MSQRQQRACCDLFGRAALTSPAVNLPGFFGATPFRVPRPVVAAGSCSLSYRVPFHRLSPFRLG
ncbi:hypothetical protein MQ088_20495 (plasmid) [Edwardsiella anguillarum]|nr:hypothetical protein [Edwardsiella anguillarum]WHP97302.1 hypothetical protein MQ096_19935 [Edwardsiella anguillarum]WHP97327.1 hypothetical protein MQ096_20495 [Edwardsiella anguillarum]WHQ16111.1 hypothetical protein MQ083_18965 [Edwardsiella anguillarum]